MSNEYIILSIYSLIVHSLTCDYHMTNLSRSPLELLRTRLPVFRCLAFFRILDGLLYNKKHL